jgi:hypothetical protein
MALVYVKKPHVSRRVVRWLLYEFIIVYKPNKTHVVADKETPLLIAACV